MPHRCLAEHADRAAVLPGCQHIEPCTWKTLVCLRQVHVALQQEAEALGRPAPGLEAAFTLELCAGIIDKKKSLQEIAAEEVGFRSCHLAAHAIIWHEHGWDSCCAGHAS